MRAVLGLMMLAMGAPECDPTSLEAAGIQPGDGGVWVGGQDGGVFIGDERLVDFKNRPLPSDELLCKLLIGDLNNTTEASSWQGIWIEDIKQSWFLGPVESGGDTRDPEGAQLRYTYCDPTSQRPGCEDTINLILRFETIVAVDKTAEGVGVPWPQPYFLNGVTAMGMDRVQMMTNSKAPSCWDWKLRQTPQYHFTPCPECKTMGEDFIWCSSAIAEDPTDCFQKQ